MKTTENLSHLTDEQLLSEQQKRKTNFISISVVMVAFVLVAALNFIAGNPLIFSILPIVFLPIFMKHRMAFFTIKNEIATRTQK